MRRPLLLGALTILAALGAPAAAQAAVADAFSLGPAATSLRAQGVRLVAIPPAAITGPAWTLPVQRRSSGVIVHSGGLLLRGRRGRTLAVTGVRTPAAGAGNVSAIVAGRRITIARVAASGRVTLSAAFTTVLRRRLALRSKLSAALGVLRRAPVVSTPTPATPASPSTPGPGTTTTPPATPPTDTARTVTAATLTWHVRDSFVDYLASGQGTSALDGAVAQPPSGSPALVREYLLPLRDGWYDPATGKAAVRFSGGVRFAYAAHGLEIEARDLEIEMAPGASRVFAQFSGAAVQNPGRGPLVNLTWAAPDTGDATANWTKLPGTIPAGADTSVFAGFYFPGDDFGWFALTLRYAP